MRVPMKHSYATQAILLPQSESAVGTHTVEEWRTLRIDSNDGVPPTSVAPLLRIAEREEKRLKQKVIKERANNKLKAFQVVGVLSVPGTQVEILPKIDGNNNGSVRHALTRMLSVALSLNLAESESSSMSIQRRDLLEILIQIFTQRLLVAARRGIPRRYMLQGEDLTVLRGKLDIDRQLVQDASHTGKLACIFDELTVDTPLNRVLYTAVRQLVSLSRTNENIRRLNELLARFENVTESANPLRENVQLDRTNVPFHRLYALARLLLARDWQTTSVGKAEGYSLLFAMNDLFEVFIGKSMRVALRSQYEVHLQQESHFALRDGQGDIFQLRPDIVVDDDIIVDTKWKRLDPSKRKMGISSADVYQMLTYANAYQAKRVVLLYPWCEGLPEQGICTRWQVSGSSTLFDVATVDVGNPDEVRPVLREIIHGSA